MKEKLRIKIVFYIMLVTFLLLVSYIAVPQPMPMRQMLFPIAAFLAFIFFVLGAVLIFLAVKIKSNKRLKIFLIMTGASAMCVLASVILHNMVYGLFIYLFGKDFWQGGDEAFFFILALIVSPIVYLVGTIGSILSFKKR